MLKITAPIKTALDPDLIGGGGESFARRIMANYDQLSEYITREDLFHVVTQPPEVFLMDGGSQSYLSETEIHNTQLKKVEIINNLMNRILVSADGSLTYQDRVYITNVLHKLGIHDDQTFMNRVYELTEETKNNNRLIETYWDNLTELRQIVNSYRSEENEGDSTELTNISEETLHLHEDVFKRWMTGALYRIQNNFRTSTENVTYIDGDSYRMTEEQRLSQQILLQRLRESISGEEMPLIYRHENFYELPRAEEEALDDEAVAGQIASAVLLTLIDNLYENITTRNESVGDRFYHTENAYFGAAENVFERMQNGSTYIVSNRYEGENSLEQLLYRINTENIERNEQLTQSLLQMTEEQREVWGERPSERDIIAESSFAFLHPEEYRRQYEERAAETGAAIREIRSSFIDRLPAVSRNIFKVIEEYIKEPATYRDRYRITEGGEIFLYRESMLAERNERIQNERISEIIETERDVTNRITDRVSAVEDTVGEITTESVSLVHRTSDVTVDEETINSLREQIRRIENDTVRNATVTDNRESVTTTQINNYNETFINEQNTEAITRMVQSNINQQIGNITNKVYNRIERQLQSERRRRGM